MELCRNSCKLAQHESHANSYKFRIYPTDEQIVLIIKSFGCARWVYNHFLNECAASIYAGVSRPTYYDWHSKLTELKKAADTVWLAEPDKFAVENALKDLDARSRTLLKILTLRSGTISVIRCISSIRSGSRRRIPSSLTAQITLRRRAAAI